MGVGCDGGAKSQCGEEGEAEGEEPRTLDAVATVGRQSYVVPALSH